MSDCTGIPAIRARAPPLFEKSESAPESTSKQNEFWQPTPPEWLYGKWFMTHTSQAYYFEKTTHLTIQYAPVLNGQWPCANQELVTLTPRADCARVYTAYGIDSPVAGLDDSWYVQCTGHLSHVSDYVAFLAWGVDANEVDWVVMYSTPPTTKVSEKPTGLPPQVCIMSRKSTGPDEQTVALIKIALAQLPGQPLLGLEMKPLSHEGPSLDRLVECGYEVLQNVDSLSRF